MRKKFAVFYAMWVLLSALLVYTSCKDDSYYDRPSWLKPPVYQQLEKKGNFTQYLACVDKAGFTNALRGAGYYTVFAPTDDAFDAFYEQYDLSAETITEELAKKIVTYSLCVSPASKDTIDDYRSKADEDVELNAAFKRVTFNYKWVYEDTIWTSPTESAIRNIIDMNAVEELVSTAGGFETEDYNFKHIPFFTDDFMAQEKITAADYNYFFPETPLTEFNVVDAQVIEKDLWAENGIIHVVDKVILPLDNLEDILAKTKECSDFRDLLDKYTTSFNQAPETFIDKYEQSSGIRKDIYVKDYPELNFALNCENFMKYGGGSLMDAYHDGWTLFAPNNGALQDFYASKLFKYGYNNLNEVPDFVLTEFINAHLFRTTVWPSKFATTVNMYGEEARFDANNNVIKKQFGSNGVFYAVDQVQNTNAFRTILADVILNPNYSLMYQALKDNEPLVMLLKNPISTYRLFLISNSQFAAAGFQYNSASSSWEFTNDANRPDLGTNVNSALQRFLYLHIIVTNPNIEAEGINFTGSTGVIKTYGEEYIKYSNGVIYASGNPIGNRPVINSTTDSESINGQSYGLDRPMLFSVGNVGANMNITSLTVPANRATTLLSYLRKVYNATYTLEGVTLSLGNSAAYNAMTQKIKDVENTDYITVFVPNDPAMTAAVTNGHLKALSSFAPNNDVMTLTDDNLAIENFTKYHVVKGNIVVGGDSQSGTYTTYRKLEDGTFATLDISVTPGSPGSITITDHRGRTANVRVAATTTYNILGNRAIVHVIDNYLLY